MARQPGPLGSLSTELIQLIYENLLEYHEIVLFAVTCKMIQDDSSNARCIDLLKNFCQCADPTVDVISPRNTLLLESRLQTQFHLAAFAFAPTQVLLTSRIPVGPPYSSAYADVL